MRLFRIDRSIPGLPRLIASALVALLVLGAAGAAWADVLFEENFDNGLGAFSATGNVFTSNGLVRMRGGSSDGVVTSPAISTAGFTNIALSFDRTTSGLDNGEAGIASVSINGGSFGVVESTQSANGRTTIALGTAAAGGSIVIRFAIDASSFFETYEVDDVVVEGDPDGGEPPPPPPPPPPGENSASGFYLEGGSSATTPDQFSITNTGGFDITSVVIDLGTGSGSPLFDPADVPFAVTSGDSVGFSGSFGLSAGNTVLQLSFDDFNPGETFAFDTDLDDEPGTFTTGAEVAGSFLTVSAAGANDATGTYEEDGADANRANVTATEGGEPPPPPPPPPPGCGNLQPGQFDCDTDGRDVNVYVPASYDGSTAVPLVVDMHGFTSDNTSQQGVSGWDTLADVEGFIVAYPQGVSNSWNAQGDCCGSSTADDVQFIRNVVADIQAAANIDASRIYATGLSNGGSMTHTLACEAADLFAAASAVSFGLSGGNGTISGTVANCNPSQGIPVVHFHGTNDSLVDYNNGVLDSLGAPDSLEAWRQIQSCSSSSTTQQLSSNTTCETHAGCDDGVEVRLCTVSGGTHVLYPDVNGAGIPRFSWDFFQQF